MTCEVIQFPKNNLYNYARTYATLWRKPDGMLKAYSFLARVPSQLQEQVKNLAEDIIKNESKN